MVQPTIQSASMKSRKGKKGQSTKPFNPKKYIKPETANEIWGLRKDEKTQMLTGEKLSIVQDAIVKHNDRLKAKRGEKSHLPPTSREKLQTQRYDAVSKLVKDLYQHPRPNGRVGGNTYIEVKIGQTANAEGRSTTEWDNKYKWPGNNAHLSVTIQVTWLSLIGSVPGLADAEKLLTTHAEQVGPDLWKASWVEQGRGFGLKTQSGYILRADGEYYHGKSEDHVRKVFKKKLAEKHAAGLIIALQIMRDQIWKGQPVSADLLENFPELVAQMPETVHEKINNDLDHAIAFNEPIKMDGLVDFPDLMAKYRKWQERKLLQRLCKGEHVAVEELLDFPNLLVEFGA